MLTIVGTIKIGNTERLEHVANNLRSMEPIAHLLTWQLNIAGLYGNMAREIIRDRWPNAQISTDSDTCAYQVMAGQLNALPDDTLCLYWLEDHWYICGNTTGFLSILDEFEKSKAEVLTVSHLVSSWEQKQWLPIPNHNEWRTIYYVDIWGQVDIWAHHPGAYAAGVPMICKKRFAMDMLACCRQELEQSKSPAGFELPPHKTREFFAARGGFIEIVPTFHVFREVFRKSRNPRAILWDDAIRIITERGN
jgi:hypothetical protein